MEREKVSTMLNGEQFDGFELINDGHSCIVLGQAGTGKSFLIKETVRLLQDRAVSVTASTGLAALQFESATTVHHWAGLYDCRYSNSHLLQVIAEETRERIKRCQLLVIDEISMISRKNFEQLEFICRAVRDPSLYFGGLQVVCVGDFFQLPPVPNNLYCDSGEHALRSPVWEKCIPHIRTLKTVVRQSDRNLITAINELEKGMPSDQTNELMYSLDRPLNSCSSPCVLFGTNFEVECHNTTKLERLTGNARTYSSIDVGEQKYFRNIHAQKEVVLKVGSPVMLIRNLSPSLVNGLVGEVLELGDDGPTVKFEHQVVTYTSSRSA